MDQTLDILDSQERTGTPGEDAGLGADQYGRIIEEIRRQPQWRKNADKCADYYDGNQIDQETLADLNSSGRAPLITNLVKPTVNVVLGMEAKTRSDWRVIADDDPWQDVAEAQSAKLHEAERETRADRACSDAFSGQVKAGLGWVEVSRQSDPFKYPYRAIALHRREIWWDWLAKEPDLTDARYLRRDRWFDIDTIKSYMPAEKARLIMAAGQGWPQQYLSMASEDVSLAQAFDQESRMSLMDYEWREAGTDRVALSEVWYRRMVRGHVLNLPDGRTVELDLKNPVHAAMVGNGTLKPKAAVYSKWRASLWLGPHKIIDMDPGIKRLPYIPFWGYREDLTGVPYGLIRDMLSPQDEVNARARKMMWLLSAKRMRIDSDALSTAHNDISDVLREISRPDAVIVTDPNRRNANGMQIDDNIGLSDQQFQVMQERKQAIQEVAGVFNAMMGRVEGATANSALQTLVEQGSVSLAELNDNYRYSRRLVGEALLELITQDMSGREVQVVVGEDGRKKKYIHLNTPAIDQDTGMRYVKNDTARAKTKVALEDVPSTPSYRAQQQTMLGEVMKSLPPNLQAIIAPMWIEASELPKRREIADEIRKALGLSEDDAMPDPEKEQMAATIQQLQDYIQNGTMQVDEAMGKFQTEIDDLKKRLADKTIDQALKMRATRRKEHA